jgi:hypothetical protein
MLNFYKEISTFMLLVATHYKQYMVFYLYKYIIQVIFI